MFSLNYELSGTWADPPTLKPFQAERWLGVGSGNYRDLALKPPLPFEIFSGLIHVSAGNLDSFRSS